MEEKSDHKNIIKFAEKLFYSWDDDGSGILELDEIADQLISLKLAPDKIFVLQLIRSLDPKFLHQKEDEISVTLKDFLKIFKEDKYMDNLKLEKDKEEEEKKASESLKDKSMFKGS